MSELSSLDVLKKRVEEYLSKNSPGTLQLFNIYCRQMYRADCISLLFTSPSRLYHIVLSHFRGDVTSTDLSFSILFLSPLVLLLSKSEAVRELLDLAKLGKDKEFLELVARLMGEGRLEML